MKSFEVEQKSASNIIAVEIEPANDRQDEHVGNYPIITSNSSLHHHVHRKSLKSNAHKRQLFQ